MLMKITLCLSFIVYVTSEAVNYDNYCLYKLHPESDDHLDYLNELNSEDGVDFWKLPTRAGDYASMVLSPEKRDKVEHSLKKRSLAYYVMMENIQQAFDDQIMSRRKRDAGELYWTNYQTLDDINEWFHHLARTHSDIVSIINLGKSHEGRDIIGVKISRGTSGRAIFINGGQIAADWLSPTVVTYLVNQLVLGEDPEALAASRDFEWHIFPVINPDGYEFTQNAERLWLKNRRPVSNAIGVDLSKNWNSHWGIIGGSFTPSAGNYVGLGPFSEPETRRASNYIESIGSNLVGLLSFGGFGQRLLIPYAHTTQHLQNYNEMLTIGRRAMGSLAVRYNTQYRVGTSMEVHDGATGSIADWAKFRFNPPIAATYLLRDEGVWGYTLPVNQVLPTCEETFDSVMAIIREAKFINVL
ncbi:zinc carboxypeptidase-like [Aricia agestis]|uniref:zinc carboxypeptidase-like n=1 Tax=Aricia agestis TaxID=91739 RepID=UPI001C2071DF|nr:zinc carboxypeptidase-like [Aricia agestis]